jgi:hypothetical protein
VFVASPCRSSRLQLQRVGQRCEIGTAGDLDLAQRPDCFFEVLERASATCPETALQRRINGRFSILISASSRRSVRVTWIGIDTRSSTACHCFQCRASRSVRCDDLAVPAMPVTPCRFASSVPFEAADLHILHKRRPRGDISSVISAGP